MIGGNAAYTGGFLEITEEMMVGKRNLPVQYSLRVFQMISQNAMYVWPRGDIIVYGFLQKCRVEMRKNVTFQTIIIVKLICNFESSRMHCKI